MEFTSGATVQACAKIYGDVSIRLQVAGNEIEVELGRALDLTFTVKGAKRVIEELTGGVAEIEGAGSPADVEDEPVQE
ncbi:hypothetical protein [Actinosynnema sp. NPDC020468]|uniref:hypothetical protein n=1 Tax=Actinosynnema sp. NPDC020468 TaxID=3154488 RepID=UPI0033E833F0